MSNQNINTDLLKIIFVLFFFAQNITYSVVHAAATIESPLEDCGDPRDATHLVDDYTEKTKKVLYHLFLVEKAHYTIYLPLLNKVSNTANETLNLLTNMDYTLRHFPNHHGALYIIAKLQKRMGGKFSQQYYKASPGAWHRSMECYFDRARRYQPNDPNIFLVFGIYLHSVKKHDQALAAYKISEDLKADSVELQYNLGLLYFDKKNYKLAKKYATKAYNNGFALKGLKNKLLSVKMWP